MGDSIDSMYTMSLWGYAYGQQVYPFLKSGAAVFLLLPIIAFAGLWRIANAVFEGEEDLPATFIKWLLCTVAVLGSLYNPATFSLAEKAPLSQSALNDKKVTFGTDQGSMPWIAHQMDGYLKGWVDLAQLLAKRENRFFMPGAEQSAIQNMSQSDSIEDPQTQSALSQWQQVLVPAYLLQNASLAAKIKAENLMGILMYPVTSARDINDSDDVAKRSRRVIEILNAESGLDAVGAVRSLSAHLNSPNVRLSGTAMGIDAEETAVTAPMLGAYTTGAVVASATAPTNYTPQGVKAFNAGYRVLSSVANDSERQPLATYTQFGDIYKHLGLAADVAMAKRKLQRADDITAFGMTCLNKGDAACKVAFTVAPTKMESAEGSIWRGEVDVANRALRLGNAAFSFLGSAFDQATTEFFKVKIPLIIGVAKGVVTMLTPIIMVFMLWPGRFTQGLVLILGGYVLVTLWMVLYILWTYLVCDLMFGTSGSALSGQVLGVSNVLGSYDAMVTVLKIGYAALGTVSWMLVYGGIEKAHRAMEGKTTTPDGALNKGGKVLNTGSKVVGGAANAMGKMGGAAGRAVGAAVKFIK